MNPLRLALLHLAPRLGDLTDNRRLLEAAVTAAADMGAEWVITPELCLCGYQFTERMGTAWIVPQPDPWVEQCCRLMARLRLTRFLSHPERDALTGKLHNDGRRLFAFRSPQSTVLVVAWDLRTHRLVGQTPRQLDGNTYAPHA